MMQYKALLDSIKDETKSEVSESAVNLQNVKACWYDSTFLTETYGTESALRWDPSEKLITGPDQIQAARRPGPETLVFDAALRTPAFVSYLKMSGLDHLKVQSNHGMEMNTVLSYCRAITQHPNGFNDAPDKSSEVEYLPFFPVHLVPKQAIP